MLHNLVLSAYGAIQLAYLFALGVVFWFFCLRVDTVTRGDPSDDARSKPPILLLYPVLRELEATMRTTLLAIAHAEYPRERLRVVAIPNGDDQVTIDALRRLGAEFSFLEVLEVPPTTDGTWQAVWQAWDHNPKAYWWHQGKRRGTTQLPAKKTRQLVYALYCLASTSDALLSYIDADSVVPSDYFLTAAAGVQRFDVIQNTNVAGNLLHNLPATMFAMDHLAWDGSLYPHMTAGGKHPFYTLGKGLFFRISDLLEVGGFNPWLTIEDPEIGMRLWTNGRRLGVVRQPIIEEVPLTLGRGITQRKRWAAGFFQSLASPLRLMGMSPRKRLRARLNLVPCLSLFLNPLALGMGILALTGYGWNRGRPVDLLLEVLTVVNISGAALLHLVNYRAAWRQTRAVLDTRRARVYFMARVNPVFLLLHWAYWTIPLVMGFFMYLTDRGLTWERTKKTDANHWLVREVVLAGQGVDGAPKARRLGSLLAGAGGRGPIIGDGRDGTVGAEDRTFAGAVGHSRPARYLALASILGCGLAVIALVSNAIDNHPAAAIVPHPTRHALSGQSFRGGVVSLEDPPPVVAPGRRVASLVLGSGGAAPGGSTGGYRIVALDTAAHVP